MPQPTCRRCGQPLAPIFPGRSEHPLCSPTSTGWIPRHHGRRAELPAPAVPGLVLAVELAAVGWHILPLSPATKRPLGNCPACKDTSAGAGPHAIEDCLCLAVGRWCHGVRAATTDPVRLAAWWHREPAAVPGVAAGPSGLVLVDIDAHGAQPPPDLATGLLPGIDLVAEPLPRQVWADPTKFRDGRDSLQLLAALRGGPRPWPADLGHRPVTVATPSGGRHLWYGAPGPGLHQVLADPAGRYGLAWQVDLKAGWSYGLAPGATTTAGSYRILTGDPARPGSMPGWLAREVTRVAGQPAPALAPPAGVPAPRDTPRRAGTAYLSTVIDREAARLAGMTDGRKRALAALAYHVGGLLASSGLPEHDVTDRLISAGTGSGLRPAEARRIVARALANGLARPISPPPIAGRPVRRPDMPVSRPRHTRRRV
jgi:bifunctional DNA primase/polymerase-like protein